MLKSQTGATMIEILVAVLIISIGLLGIAGTQTLGLANSQSALHRSYAAQLSNELADAMRLSPNNLAAYDGFATDPNANVALNANCTDSGQGCNAAAMATEFLNAWEQRIEANLPDGRANITLTDDLYVVEIEWKDLRTNQARQDDLAQGLTAAEIAAGEQEYITFTTSFQL
ncbi:type IV pilus modification protein PilV [Reinekea marina]|uniref:Type IV pilus modification protein PilV n=1 Tax=Reinekea marina TaxID=1310421 RepID=A0ABV7WQQ5_9GAMM|nr:type IV pilus modification protein PilV [Reinekea marina]MDN3648267.1 type IV pilus modification protein PilV [Reinekea marina]